MNADPPLHVLLGPTGAGKSELALEIAAARGFEIVAVDSRVVYRRLDIGTAKPDTAAQRRVPHHMIDCVDPRDTFDAMRYASGARAALHTIQARGREALLEGGSGFYLRALLSSGFDGPGPDPALRRAILEEASAHAPGWLHEELARLDPASAVRLHPRDTFRLVRAFEIIRTSGRPASEVRSGLDRREDVVTARIAVVSRPKHDLDRRIAARFERMIEAGLVDEVRGLLRDGYPQDLPAFRGPGYREVMEHLRGELGWREMMVRAIAATRRYAKRQLTWFRHQVPGAVWIELGPEDATTARRRVEVALFSEHGANGP